MEPCANCRQFGKVTINHEYIGYSATCDCYDGAPIHSGDSGPSAPWGITKEAAMLAWEGQNADRQADIDEDPDYCAECSRHKRSAYHANINGGHAFVDKT